jgi:hypothetical protein
MAVFHSAYRHNIVQNVSFAAAGGASAASSNFASQTRAIRICFTGAFTATAGVRFSIGNSPVASSTTQLLPPNVIECITVSPGEQIAALSNDTVTGSLSVVELSN